MLKIALAGGFVCKVLHVATAEFIFVVMSAAFWVYSIYFCIGWLGKRGYRTYGIWLITLGAAMNFAVITANRGIMPVHGETPSNGVWRKAVEGDNLTLLADYLALGGFSPGDLVVIVGILIQILLTAPPLRTKTSSA